MTTGDKARPTKKTHQPARATNFPMTAKELAEEMGATLIGKQINTEQFGTYPGGIAEVIALTPDAEAPEIVIQVRHPTFGEIGVFDFEDVSLA
jgi:hypothetical protein